MQLAGLEVLLGGSFPALTAAHVLAHGMPIHGM
jgi:hypothetical protein